jgi:hypothetical protein
MEKWSDGQLALFGALGEICEKVGPESSTGTQQPSVEWLFMLNSKLIANDTRSSGIYYKS